MHERSTRLKMLLVANQAWNVEMEALRTHLEETEKALALEQSLCDVNRSILQVNLGAAQEEVCRIQKIQIESS